MSYSPTTMPPTVWSPDFSGGLQSGLPEYQLADWIRVFNRDGAAGTVSWGVYGDHRNMAGLLVTGIEAHDDWRWAASRFTEGSMAAYFADGNGIR